MSATLPGIHIVRAREESLGDINALIARSKAHWNWPEGYLEAALPLQAVTLAYLRGNHCFEVLDERETTVGFFAAVASGTRVVLDHLWVTPELIGHGIGRQACEHVFRLARQQGWLELWVLPDPPAEGFYGKVGFSDTGERVASRVPGGPVFSVYRIQVSRELAVPP